MSSKISIKAINELLEYEFNIPSYQRGYRWTMQQVKDLLNDINEFTPTNISNSNEETWYCLQPIVVKKNTEVKFDVIDGQQRLTTIYLILYYLNQEYKEVRTKIFELEYETRKDSANYLKNELGKKEKDDSNIDYFHISVAYQTIKDWFKNKDKKSFESKLSSSVKVIWYETSKDAKNEVTIDIFTRINSGKIPLTNAELIKALFLNSSNFGEIDSEKLRLKQLEIATEWDRIEYALQDDSFWYFINKSENNLQTRIEFIFNLMYDLSIKEFGNNEYSTFNFFYEKFKPKSEKEIKENWLEAKKYFQTLEEWYFDRELYHKIGYLITIGKTIKEILTTKEKKLKKSDFKKWIDKQIKSRFENVNIEEIEYNKGNVREILLLHNIQTMLNNQNETNHFPFDQYKKESWDVEHIHAIATNVKVKKEDQVEWLKNNYINPNNVSKEKPNNVSDEIVNKIDSITKENITIEENEFDKIKNYVLGEEDNSLRNLCLLDRGTNRSYKNDSFKEKRKKIIKREIEGTFIPICTKNLFLKYYTDNFKDLEVWNEEDRKAYLNDIKSTLHQYLTPKITTNEQ